MIVTLVKAVHIAALIIWCAGLVALPLALGSHERDEAQADYARLRRITHYSYIRLVTPAAVVAIIAGTTLVFLRATFEPWLFAKLVAVGLLVSLHALIGHTVVLMSERAGDYVPPSAVPLILVTLATMVAVLVLVLAKPRITEVFPDWLDHPRGRQLPFDETPI